jgi:hypothetical protein
MGVYFEYEIITLKSHPSSDYEYLARIGSIVRHLDDRHETVSWDEHRIPESWGMSQDEAYNNLETLIKAWIATQE